MSKIKAIEKKIDSHISRRNTISTVIILIIGGILGLILNFSKIGAVLIVIGVFWVCIFVKSIINIEDKINFLIKELETNV